MEEKSIYLLFVVAILIHNIEEAVWLPAWSKSAKRFMKPIESAEFRFAVLLVTILAVLCTAAFMFFSDIIIIKYFYFGFLGAMIINVFVPHLVATVTLKKYAPGLISGLLLNLPINSVIIYRALNAGVINTIEFIVSTIIVGTILLLSLPLLFKLGKLVKEYQYHKKEWY